MGSGVRGLGWVSFQGLRWNVKTRSFSFGKDSSIRFLLGSRRSSLKVLCERPGYFAGSMNPETLNPKLRPYMLNLQHPPLREGLLAGGAVFGHHPKISSIILEPF